jgi:hypothetical protein
LVGRIWRAEWEIGHHEGAFADIRRHGVQLSPRRIRKVSAREA